MRKRIFAIVLSIIFCFNMVTNASDRSYEFENKAMEFLTDMGIVDGSKNIEPDVYLTRAETAMLFAEVFKLDAGYGGEQIYKDVTPDMDSYTAISQLCVNGVVSRADEFRPNDRISMEEFMVIAVNSIGYGVPAQQTGGFPTGYTGMAKRLGILDGVTWDSAGVMYSQAAAAIYNLLHCEMSEMSVNGELLSLKKTVLEYVYGIYIAEGIVTDNGITSLTGTSTVDEKQIAVDGVGYYTTDNFEKWLGYSVRAYYEHDEKTDKNTITYVYPQYNKANIYEFMYDELEYANGKYTDVDNEITYNVLPSTKIIYNGLALSSAEYTDPVPKYKMLPTYGTVTIISYSGSNADVVLIDSYENYVVKNVVIEDEMLSTYDQCTVTDKILKLKDKEYRIFDTTGKSLKLSDINKEKTSLLVAQSINGEFIRIIAGGEVVKGNITSIVSTGSASEYIIDGGAVEVSPNFTKTLSIGNSGDFYLDAFRRICYFDFSSSTSDIYGCVLKVAEKNEGIEDKIVVKLLNQFNLVQNFNIAKSVKIDNTTYKLSRDKTAILGLLNSLVEKVVLYKQNAAGEITALDTQLDNSEDGFQVINGMDNESVYYYKYLGSFGGRVMIDNSTLFFLLPKNGDLEQSVVGDVALYNKTHMMNGNTTVSVYKYGKNTVRAAAMVGKIDYAGEGWSRDIPYIITGISKSLNSNGDLTYQLDVIRYSSAYTFNTESTGIVENVTIAGAPYELSVGDMVHFGLNKNMEVRDPGTGASPIGVVYSVKNNYFETDRSINTAYSTTYIPDEDCKRLYIYDTTDVDGVYYATLKDPCTETITDNDLYLYKLGNFKNIYRYDAKNETVQPASVMDLKAFKDVDAERSVCIMSAYSDRYSDDRACLMIY